ncbi:MAG: YkgJ family cysteine cluster protein [Campylobacterales bacterium]
MSEFRLLSPNTSVTFSSCGSCRSCCGEKFFAAPLILNDFSAVASYFPIFFAHIKEWRAVIPLGSQTGMCPYLDHNGCTIYDKRPPACRLYPLSPFNDQLAIDRSCPAVDEPGIFLYDGQVSPLFYHERLQNFNDKLIATRAWLSERVDRFVPFTQLRSLEFYCLEGAKDEFEELHLNSLAHASIFGL